MGTSNTATCLMLSDIISCYTLSETVFEADTDTLTLLHGTEIAEKNFKRAYMEGSNTATCLMLSYGISL